ncbi:MAG: hypothetical protein GXX10_11305 [Clostridiaceae bacterium]|nr:hypothetical protein [Clostridiaceae bacterium]
MGKIENGKSKIPALIDFLYRDTSIIDSLYAQLFSGNIKQVQSEMSSTVETEHSIEGSLPFMKAVKGDHDISLEKTTSQIDPHDAKIIELFDTIGISVNEKPLHDCVNGEIVLITGDILLRNINTIKSCLPLLSSLGMLTSAEKSFNQSLGTAGVKTISTVLNTRNFANTLEKMFDMLNFPLHIEIQTNTYENAMCPLNEQYLSISSKDLLSIYGPSLPGQWSVIGILSHVEQAKPYTITNPNNLRQIADFIQNELRKFANDGAPKYIIKPIVIYQKLIFA